MINSENLCMSCMKEIGEVEQCPHCGYHVNTPQISPYLPVRTVVGNRYLVGKLLEYNGDGATYIAWDIHDKRPVKIREFLPDSLCSRKLGETQVAVMSGCEIAFNECMSDFLELWLKLTRMGGLSAMENVIEVFQENLTAYAIIEYIESISLRDFLLRNKTGYIPWERARTLFMPVLSTLGMLHTAGVIHRGISPVTLNIGRDGKMRIGGFSIWQARTARGDLTAQIFPGYAAVEQYGFEGKQGPWTDIYSFAATLYRALIGSDPIEATERLTNDRLMVPGRFAEQLPAYVINGLINALQILPEDRTRSVEQLRSELSASPTATAQGELGGTAVVSPVVNSEPKRTPTEKKPTQSKPAKSTNSLSQNKLLIIKTMLISVIVCLLIFLVVVLVMDIDFNSSKEEETKPEITTTAEMLAVPMFVNRNYAEIVNIPYWTSNFNIQKIEVYDDNVSQGCVISQDIDAGLNVNVGTTVTLTVSLGKEKFELPNVIGMDYEAAKALLNERKFTVVRKEVENDGAHGDNTVKELEGLKVGQKYDKGMQVTVVVWAAAQTQQPTLGGYDETTTNAVEEPTTPTQEPTTPVEEPTTLPQEPPAQGAEEM